MSELQNKMRVLVREKIDALSLKAKMEEQYNILTALLQAKVIIASVFMYHKLM